MDLELLEEIGLTKSEIKVFLALLELGSSTTGPIVEKSGSASSKVYEVLEKLMQKGLVSVVIKAGTKYFEAASPDRLLDYMYEKELRLAEQKKNLKKLLPELVLKQAMADKSETIVFKGMKGAQTAFDDMMNLKRGEEIIGLGFSDVPEFFQNFLIRYHKKRSKAGIHFRGMFGQQLKNMSTQLNAMNCSTIKLYALGVENPVAVLTYADKTLLSMPMDKLWIQIKNKRLADANRERFNAMWDERAHTYQGNKNVEAAYDSVFDFVQKHDEVVVFAAKPLSQKSALYNINWAKKLRSKVKRFRLLYYGENEKNKKRAKEFADFGCETKIIPTDQSLSISTVVIGDFVMNTVWGKDSIAFTVQNNVVAKSLRGNFNLLWDQNTTVVKGKDAMVEALMNFVSEVAPGDTFDALGATFGLKGNKKEFVNIFKKYHEYRIARGVKARLLFQPGARKLFEKNKQNYENAETRFLPYDTDSPVSIHPYKDRTMLIIQETEPTVITIHNKEVTKSFEKHFESLWNQETAVLRGLDAIQGLFEEMLEAGSCDYIGARGYFMDLRPDWITKVWAPKAEKINFRMRNLVDDGVKGHKITRFPFAETKYTLQKEFSSLSVFWIYGEKVVITNWVEDEPIAFVINNKGLHGVYKKQFELLWNS